MMQYPFGKLKWFFIVGLEIVLNFLDFQNYKYICIHSTQHTFTKEFPYASNKILTNDEFWIYLFHTRKINMSPEKDHLKGNSIFQTSKPFTLVFQHGKIHHLSPVHAFPIQNTVIFQPATCMLYSFQAGGATYCCYLAVRKRNQRDSKPVLPRHLPHPGWPVQNTCCTMTHPRSDSKGGHRKTSYK